MYVCVCMCMCVYVCECLHYAFVCMRACVSMYACVCVYVCLCVYCSMIQLQLSEALDLINSDISLLPPYVKFSAHIYFIYLSLSYFSFSPSFSVYNLADILFPQLH